MTGVIAAIISAGTAILVVLLGDLLSGSKIFKKLEKHDEVDGSSHQKLSKEHMILINNTNNILHENQKIETKIDEANILLKTEKEMKLAQLASLTDKQKEMTQSIDKLTSFSDEFQRLSLHNTKLIREVDDLQQENKELRANNRKLRDRINDLEQDYEYEV